MSLLARQRTVQKEITFSGVGLHSGVECRAVLRPSEADAGIVFRRTDLDGGANLITASPSRVVFADHGTTLANESGVKVATVEHIMAALALCGIDNVVVDVEGSEIPILDGSSAQFVREIAGSGCLELMARRKPLAIYSPVRVEDGDRFIEFTPGPRRIHVEIDFDNCLIGRQALTLNLENEDDLAKLACARTFCRLEEVQVLKDAGLIRGGALANSIVVDGNRLLNEEPLRDPSEFALHKALDLIGDLYLLGAPINGTITAVKPGHAINTRAAQELLQHFQGDQTASVEAADAMRATA
ncbi:UDP-3-O-acyl-N-acetylglucosamine deacetylase [Hyphococcus flavus]|uniref:UDP-3-O-acyl-N-acetylglucosamine deacetylase n=1 Tax=Hyphococcus flavus TaxID=1866326 RepID=A0AAF0CG78_9PROT|nr:UDP-3-O-acyl-N-acetylglucosamine deacetylase [Hyphococcus flavus]WDI30402.1 UDP-3-O-acyl-N-acetylglucosamine deacetylase [Hyphococcus flavus]